VRIFRRKKPALPEADLAFAREWVSSTMGELRARLSFDEAKSKIDETEHNELESPSGKRLCGEIQYFWDSGKEGDIRVIVDVWWPEDPHWSSSPLAHDDSILGPDGSFVGECPNRSESGPRSTQSRDLISPSGPVSELSDTWGDGGILSSRQFGWRAFAIATASRVFGTPLSAM